MFPGVDRAIQQFLAARDLAGLLAAMGADATLRYRGRLIRRDRLARLLALPGLRIEAAGVAQRGRGSQVDLVLGLGPDGAGHTAALRTCLHLSVDGDSIVGLEAGPAARMVIPAPVTAFINAVNGADLEGLLTTFSDDAMVNDQLCEYWGRPAIAGWAAREIVGDCLSIGAVNIALHYGTTIVTAHVDGNYDKRGLPEPLVLAFYFSTCGDKIVQLIILRNIAGV